MTSSRPLLVAHRGHAGLFPENTLAAIRSAIDVGAKWIEIDVQLTRDEVIVLFHDRTLDRTCAVPGTIHEHELADLARFSAHEPQRFDTQHAGEPIATLRDVVALIAAHEGVQLFVEVKRVAIENHGLEVVLDRVLEDIEPIRDRTILISFSFALLAACRNSTDLPVGTILESWNERESEAHRALAPEFVFCNHEKLPAEGRLDLEGHARLALYEIVDPALAVAYTERGASLIETFEFASMTEALEKAPS